MAVAALLVAASPAAAATFTVTGLGDSTGAPPCGGGTSCPSIREALAAAEANGGGADTIVIPAGDTQLIGGHLQVDSPVTIVGAGARATHVHASTQVPGRVFNVVGTTAVISSLTMSGGEVGCCDSGGNLLNQGTVMLDRVRVTGGHAGEGGGVANVDGTMTILNSLIDNNNTLNHDSTGDGGGVVNAAEGPGATATLTMKDSTITNNVAAEAGGGISARGSGFSPATSTTTLERVTIADNVTVFGPGGGIARGDGAVGLAVKASIVSGNTFDGGGSPSMSDCGGSTLPTSSGGNVVGTTDCGFTGPDDAQGVNPMLSPTLVNAGGQTDVRAISSASPALDRVPGCSGTDQRDLARPQGPACDSGAYEIDQPEPPTQSPPAAVQEPEPEFHKTAVVEKVSGTVRVRLKGSRRFVTLNGIRSIPLGSTVDVKKGVVELTSEPGRNAEPETARFYAGIFRVTQPGKITQLALTEALARCTTGRASAAARKAKKRKLWGDGKGKFRTKGSYSSATVRGTKWLVSDSCAGTLTRVVRGVVTVRDRVKRKTIRVRAGERYLARP